MTEQEKQILLVDLCARLPYGVKVQNNSYKTTSINTIEGFDGNVFIMKETYESLNFNTNISTTKNVTGYIQQIKPYLRSMSSMTEEERNELMVVYSIDYIDEKIVDFGEFLCEGSPVNIKNIYGLLDWLNSKMFDYRGLIPMGLALEATEDMYNS